MDATERWMIVATHHPPYSAGIIGSDLEVRRQWVPLFEKYGVDLVLSGHDHDYQRSKPINDVVYVISGAAAKVNRTAKEDFTDQAWGVRHFVDLAIWADRIELKAIDQASRVFDELTIQNGP